MKYTGVTAHTRRLYGVFSCVNKHNVLLEDNTNVFLNINNVYTIFHFCIIVD